MKKFLIDYKPSLGAYLDDVNMKWETTLKGGNEYIIVYCKDAKMLFNMACNYQKWVLKIAGK